MLRRRCEECGERLARNATACPECGARLVPSVKTNVDRSGLLVILFFAGQFLLGFVLVAAVDEKIPDRGRMPLIVVLGIPLLGVTAWGAILLIDGWLQKRRFSGRLKQIEGREGEDDDEDESPSDRP